MFGLEDKQVALICGCFAARDQIEEVKIFGSRAKGAERPNSDIDLVYWGRLNLAEHMRLHEDLERLPLPYEFDLKCYDDIRHPGLKDHIERVARTFYRKKPLSPAV